MGPDPKEGPDPSGKNRSLTYYVRFKQFPDLLGPYPDGGSRVVLKSQEAVVLGISSRQRLQWIRCSGSLGQKKPGKKEKKKTLHFTMFGPHVLSDNLGTAAGVLRHCKLSPQNASEVTTRLDYQRWPSTSSLVLVVPALAQASTCSKTPSLRNSVDLCVRRGSAFPRYAICHVDFVTNGPVYVQRTCTLERALSRRSMG